jgi:hypothetical protein
MTSKGSLSAYLSALVLADYIVILATCFTSLVTCKLLCFGFSEGFQVLNFSSLDVFIVLILSLYLVSTLLFTGYLVTILFKREKSYLTWNNMIGMAGLGLVYIIGFFSLEFTIF